MSWLWIGLTALFLLDALRLRGRAGALAVAKPSSADSAGGSDAAADVLEELLR